MEPELFSQAGMELSCQKFSDRLNAETDQRGPSFNVFMQNRFEACSFEAKTLLLSFPVTDAMRNPMGVMHGGAGHPDLLLLRGVHYPHHQHECLLRASHLHRETAVCGSHLPVLRQNHGLCYRPRLAGGRSGKDRMQCHRHLLYRQRRSLTFYSVCKNTVQPAWTVRYFTAYSSVGTLRYLL